jgi:hypothetical protein
MFHLDVAKVDWDVAHVAMTIHACCKYMFQMFYLFFQTYVASMFIWMLHMFHMYVAIVLAGCCIFFAMTFHVFSAVFASVSNVCFKCFICLQTFIANISSGCFKSRSCVAHVAMASVADGQWPRQGFDSYLARRASPSPLLSSPSPSLHLTSALALALALGWGSSRVLRSDAGASVGWDAGRGGVGCDAGAGVGVASGRPGASPSIVKMI